MYIYVENKTTGIISIGIPGATPEGQKHAQARDIQLNPGINRVTQEDWALYPTTSKAAQAYLKGKTPKLAVVGQPTKEDESPLVKMTVEDAVAFVEATFNDAVLGEWAVGERRGKVRTALEAQRAKIQPGAPA